MTEAERLAERLEELLAKAEQEDDDIRYYSGSSSKYAPHRDALNIAMSEALPVLLSALRSQAEELERLRGALGAVTKTANLLYANAVGCATNHYGDDIHEHGLPGWLADCAKDIQAARAALGER